MFKLMGKEINAILGAHTILIWAYAQVHIINIFERKNVKILLSIDNFKIYFGCVPTTDVSVET